MGTHNLFKGTSIIVPAEVYMEGCDLALATFYYDGYPNRMPVDNVNAIPFDFREYLKSGSHKLPMVIKVSKTSEPDKFRVEYVDPDKLTIKAGK